MNYQQTEVLQTISLHFLKDQTRKGYPLVITLRLLIDELYLSFTEIEELLVSFNDKLSVSELTIS